MSEFACNQVDPEIAMDAIHLIRKCGKFVKENKVNFPENEIWVRGWFPVLFELSCVINRSKLDIRTRSLTILFDIVKQYGESFETNWWKDLFGVLFRIFDQVKFDKQEEAASPTKMVYLLTHT